MNLKNSLLVIPAIIGMFALGVVPAHASEVQDRIDAVLAEYGGEQTAWNEVSWDGGDTVLTVAGEASISRVGGCADGKFCAYSLAGYSGSRLTFSTCTSNISVSSLGASVRSIANSRSSGTVTAYNGGSAVLSVGAGSGANTSATITSLGCS